MRGTKVLLDNCHAQINDGQKVGLIGANGAGKSSLFAMLQGRLQAEQGECAVPKHWHIATVAQETPATERVAIEYVIDGDRQLRSLQQQLAEAEQRNDGHAIGHLHTQLEDAGAYDVQSRAAQILHGLGFEEDQLSHPVSAFSGGWRMRLNLAQALVCRSDLLLLDEPTNHLDLDTVIWLEQWLTSYTGTMILISHDKSFLDNTVNHILSIEEQALFAYTGGYSAFLKQRAIRLEQQQSAFEKQQEKAAHLQKFIDRFRAKASKAKQAQSRIKQLEKMADLMPVQQQSPFSFGFADPPKLPNPLVSMEAVQLGYGQHKVISELKLNLVPGSRIGLLGRNGAGKSTLIKLLAGEIQPQAGDYQPSAGLQVGYFAQHQLEYLHADSSPLQHLMRLDDKASEQQLRDFLGGFGFKGDAATGPVGPFSGGEKARMVLALIVYQKPNLLLLDEPTNHLDMNMRDALSLALQTFDGAMILVSHDRALLEAVSDEFYLVDKQRVSPFAGDLDDYRRYLLDQARALKTVGNSAAAATVPDRKEQKRREAQFRQQIAPLKKQIEKEEKLSERLQKQLDEIEAKLADTAMYSEENKAQLTTLLANQTQVKRQLSEVEASWMENIEALETAQQAFDDAAG